MSYHPVIPALILVSSTIVACAPGQAETPCLASGRTSVVRPDTAPFDMPTVDPGSAHDSAMVVTPPCPDGEK